MYDGDRLSPYGWIVLANPYFARAAATAVEDLDNAMSRAALMTIVQVAAARHALTEKCVPFCVRGAICSIKHRSSNRGSK